MRFAALPRLAYLNSGSYGLLADSVQAAIHDYMAWRIEVGADWDAWVERSFAFGGKLARLIGAEPDEIAVTGSASSGINSLASALDFSGPRNRVLVSNYEFPTSGQIWHAQAPRGAVVQHIEEDGDRRIPLEHFERAIDERTAVVALSRVCYRHGGRLLDEEVREIVKMAHRHGALVILDCFQSLGAETIDVKALGVDFVVGGTYKYLLGTAGIGYFYARRELIGKLVPTMSGWFAQERIGAMSIFENEPSHTASRFQAGTPPVLPCYASDAGLGMILELGPQAIEAQVNALTALALERFAEQGFQIATPIAAHGPMIAIRSTDADALVRRLIERQIVTSHRDGNLRAGFHFYNDAGDLDRLIGALNDNRELLA
ncbi:aminotransferase class V-fold PLP-dependent enzyme [Sphingomonas sp. dw_22]|uniref:aminotransferase class V-fold PLP-dependent enzyme n=1 Tax=Sphingomonas sp. dw_22 TaxID=2721175 RepID=UPI001BD4F401|nr:aminotransferase class V-fold PLP-dependent enzyme [Sphingomonas sp. dw_22]